MGGIVKTARKFGEDITGVSAARGAAGKVQSAAEEQATKLDALAKPYTDQLTTAMPKLSGLIDSQYLSKVGKDSPWLKSAHLMNTENIDKAAARSTAETTRTWSRAGNVGRGRGEAMRIAEAAVQGKNQENLQYGTTQEAYKSDAAQRAASWLNQLVSTGSYGTQLSVSAINAQAAGTANAASIVGQAQAGAISGLWQVAGAVATGGMSLAASKNNLEAAKVGK